MSEDRDRAPPGHHAAANDVKPEATQAPAAPDPHRKRPKRPPALLDFQPAALEIEDAPPPRASRVTLYSAAGFLAAMVTWAGISNIDQVVTAGGRLVTQAPNQVVQPLETAVIRSIEVSPGDVVEPGDLLATLDPTVAEADVKQLRVRRSAMAARMARLEAETDGGTYTPAESHGAEGLLQADLFRQRHSHRQAQVHKLDEDIARATANLSTNRSGQAALERRVAVMAEVEDMRQTLFSNQTGSRLSLLEARALRLELEGDLEQLRRQEAELVHQVEALRAERAVFLEDFRRAALEELAQVRSEHDRLSEELEKVEFRRRKVALTAPSRAIVLDMADRSVGSVVREAEPLFTLVPLDQPVEAEVAVDTRDIGLIHEGQTVRVKLTAFPFQKHGTATGVVRTVSGDAFSGDEGSGQPPYYRTRIELTDVELRDVPDSFRLLPGMTVQAEIHTGHRTVLSYFLYPLLRGLDESVREP